MSIGVEVINNAIKSKKLRITRLRFDIEESKLTLEQDTGCLETDVKELIELQNILKDLEKK